MMEGNTFVYERLPLFFQKQQNYFPSFSKKQQNFFSAVHTGVNHRKYHIRREKEKYIGHIPDCNIHLFTFLVYTVFLSLCQP